MELAGHWIWDESPSIFSEREDRASIMYVSSLNCFIVSFFPMSNQMLFEQIFNSQGKLFTDIKDLNSDLL